MGLKNSVARNLRKPSTGFVARIVVKKVFKQKNVFLELHAVRLCQMEPHHHVLEIGFGPGIGLKAATETIVDGKVYGGDYSPEMVKEARRLLASEIAGGRAEVELADAASLPYPDACMDRVYHCNCYYFWPEPAAVAGELLRVLKPGGLMVTTLCVDSLRAAAGQGFLEGAPWQPGPYVESLRKAGFSDVAMEDLVHVDGSKTITYQAILAHKK